MKNEKNQNDLIKQYKTYQKIVVNSPTGIIVMGASYKIIEFNDSAEMLTGIKNQVAINSEFSDILPQIAFELDSSKMDEIIRCKVNEKDLHVKKFTVISKSSQIDAVILMIQELSEVVKLATELERSQHVVDELQMILEGSFDGFLVTDGKGNVLMVNKSYERVTGIRKEDMMNKNMKELINPDYMKNSVAFLVIDKKKPVSMHHTTKHGRNIMVTGMPVFNENGEIFRVVINARDISEIYELRQELLKTKEMEKLYFRQIANKDEKVSNNKTIVVVSEIMQDVFLRANKVSGFNATVLIYGESGVGKEEVAKYIHQNSIRKSKAFISINCGAIPENLLESELFGYEQGAFTGAGKDGKEGLFEAADGGILFLDEIGEMPQNLQVKLLRVLEIREIIRVGATKSKPIDVRILAATNKDLKKMVETKEFREDLYYRLNVVQIKIPPLRERVEDIAPLSMHFLQNFNKKYGQNKKLTYDVIKELETQYWRGNIRELKNVIERMLIVSDNEYLQITDLSWNNNDERDNEENIIRNIGIVPLNEMVEKVEKHILNNALKKYKSSRKIAEVLKVDKSTVTRKMNKYGINKED